MAQIKISLPATAEIGCETLIFAFEEVEQPAALATVTLTLPELPVPQLTFIEFVFIGPMDEVRRKIGIWHAVLKPTP